MFLFLVMSCHHFFTLSLSLSLSTRTFTLLYTGQFLLCVSKTTNVCVLENVCLFSFSSLLVVSPSVRNAKDEGEAPRTTCRAGNQQIKRDVTWPARAVRDGYRTIREN